METSDQWPHIFFFRNSLPPERRLEINRWLASLPPEEEALLRDYVADRVEEAEWYTHQERDREELER